VLRRVIFQKLRVESGDIIQFIPFVHVFYTFKFPLFYNHRNHEGDVTIIRYAMGTRQINHWGGALFVLVHLGFYILQLVISHHVYFHPLLTTFTS
jgi:hypothetical protein